MAKTLDADFLGLVTAPGMRARAKFSFAKAWNVTFDQPGVVRCRRGVDRVTGVGGPIFSVAANRALGSNVLMNFGASLNPDALAYGNGTSSTTIAGTVTNTPLRRMRTAQSQRNTYITSNEGVQRLDTSFALAFAGMPRGLPVYRGEIFGSTYTQLTGAGGFLADGSSAAYRTTWHLLDPQGVELGGSPLGRHIVRNLTGTTGYAGGTARNVVNRLPIPAQFGTASTALTTSFKYRLWRSRSNTTEPDDECYLVAEGFLTSTDLANGYVSVTDSTTDAVLVSGPALHTNANDYLAPSPVLRKGILNADEPPPLARDLALWRDHLLFAETESKYYFNATMISLPADGDTFLIGALTLTFRNAPAATTDVQISSGYASGQHDIEATARNLVDVINRFSTEAYAFYLSGPNQLAGQLFFESRVQGTNLNIRAATGGTKYRPDLTTNLVFSIDAKPNGLRMSKPLRGDAVPPANDFAVGPADARLLRIISFRDRVFAFTDYGVYVLTGTGAADLDIQPFNLGLQLIARESVVACDDAVYAWCKQGIARITTSGTEIISAPIENLLTSIVTSTGYDAMAAVAFSVAHEFEHKVLFFYPQTSDTGLTSGTLLASEAFVWDTRTELWSRWRTDKGYQTPDLTNRRLGYSCGIVRFSDDLLFFGDWNHSSSDGYLYQERRTYSSDDYQDSFQDGDRAGVQPELQPNFYVLAGASGVHFQELVIHWESDPELGGRTPPTEPMTVTMEGLHGTASTSTAAIAGAKVTRIPVVQEARRGDRLSVNLQRPAGAIEPWGIVLMQLLYEPDESNRTVRS